MSRSLKYPFTCPDVDAQIRDCKSVLTVDIESLVLALCPTLNAHLYTSETQEMVEDLVDSFYENLEGIFEGCRKINEDMRDEADLQISEAVEEVVDLQQQVNDLQERLAEYE